MNITIRENSPDKLKLALHPTGCFLVGGAILFIAMGLIVIWLLGDVIRFHVSNKEIHYERVFLGAKVRKEFTIPVDDLTDLSLELKEGFSPTYKITLHVEDELFEVDLPMSDGDEKRAIVDQLDAEFRKIDGTEHFDLEESGIIGAMLLGGACIVGGLFCLYFLQTVVVIANRTTGHLRIYRHRTLLPFGDRREIDLNKFQSIEAREITTTNSNEIITVSYEVIIHWRGGKPLKIAHGPMFTEKSSAKLVELVENWMAGKTA